MQAQQTIIEPDSVANELPGDCACEQCAIYLDALIYQTEIVAILAKHIQILTGGKQNAISKTDPLPMLPTR